jgi:hypothetical protein
MRRAGDDWLHDLIPIVGQMKPLTDKESIMGCDGVRFLDALPMSTSMGFPLFGKKHKYFEDVVVDGQLLDRIPSQTVIAERDRLLKTWSRGERAYPVTSATLKDEPTAMVKNPDGQWELPEKVRVFQCSAVAMSLCIRKYFLPVVRFLSTHPIESECAVGLNCMSDQWEVLMEHAWQYSEDEVLALDYSKYDARMNSQLTHFVWSLFIQLAEASGGYTEDDIHVMKMMVTDIVHPLVDWNGTMIMLYSMNTSGHNLTVHLNSCANSIYTRMGFFHHYPSAPPFRECVAMTTYGDDLNGSVHHSFRDFNFESYRDFLAEFGMKITLPDKSGESQRFLPRERADFLKRTSVYIPEIDTTVGALDEDSIFKSLHVNLKSKVQTPRQVSASCIETAMHEWFAHGRDVYNRRQQQMEEVCRRARLPIPAVGVPFDDRIEKWKLENLKT